MKEITLESHKSLLKHAKTLAVLYFIFGGFHAFIFALWLMPALVLLISMGSRTWENEFVRDAVTGSSIFLPILAILPLITSNSLRKRHRSSIIFLAISGFIMLLYSLMLIYISILNPIGARELSYAIYFLPCLLLSVYSLWCVVGKRAV